MENGEIPSSRGANLSGTSSRRNQLFFTHLRMLNWSRQHRESLFLEIFLRQSRPYEALLSNAVTAGSRCGFFGFFQVGCMLGLLL